MNNARTIAALEKTIAQLIAVKDRLTAADAKAENSATPAKKSAAKKSVAKKSVAKKSVARKAPAKKNAARKTA